MVNATNARAVASSSSCGQDDDTSMDEIAHILSRLTQDEVAVAQALREIESIRRSDADALSDLSDVVAQLQTALDSRVSLEQAKGMLFAGGAESLDAAFHVMRSHARSHNLTLLDVAARIVTGQMSLGPDGVSVVSAELVAAGSPSPR